MGAGSLDGARIVLLCLFGEPVLEAPPRLSHCRGAAAAPRPGAPGWPRVTHQAPQPQRAPRLPRAKTNKQQSHKKPERREGGRERELPDLPPTPPGRHRKPAGPGASAEPPPARPPAGAASPGKKLLGGLRGERHATQLSLPAVGEGGGCPGASRLAGSGETARLLPFRGKSHGERRKMHFSGLRLRGCQRCVLPS